MNVSAMPGEVSLNHPAIVCCALHMRAREVIACRMADVEGDPDPTAYAVADDVLLALHNAGLVVVDSDASVPKRNTED